MRRYWRWFLRGLFYVALVVDGVLVIGAFAYRLANPELTETQLLMRWWAVVLLVLILNLVAYYGVSHTEQERE